MGWYCCVTWSETLGYELIGDTAVELCSMAWTTRRLAVTLTTARGTVQENVYQPEETAPLFTWSGKASVHLIVTGERNDVTPPFRNHV